MIAEYRELRPDHVASACGIERNGEMEFAEKVRNLLKAHGLSQSDLAEALGTNQQQVSRWLEANAPPKWAYLLKMARALDVTADYLIDNSLEEVPRPSALPDDEAALLRVYRHLRNAGRLDEGKAINGLTLATQDFPVKITGRTPAKKAKSG